MRRPLWTLAGAIILFAIATVFSLSAQDGSSIPPPANSESSTVTPPVDDLDSQISQETSQLPGVIMPPAVILYGQSSLTDHLTQSQADKVVSILDDFVMAHSGLAFSTGIISIDTQEISDNALHYLLSLSSPQASYRISVIVSGTYSNNPIVHFERAT